LLTACGSPKGRPGVSDDIEDSKNRGVFIAEYKTLTNPYKINDTLQLTINEAWIETKWIHTSDPKGASSLGDSYQLCINTIKHDLKNLTITWYIGISAERYLRLSSNNSLMGDLKTLEKADTLIYPVQNGANLSNNSYKDIIGKLVLIKK
jgi:hypothetical protein